MEFKSLFEDDGQQDKKNWTISQEVKSWTPTGVCTYSPVHEKNMTTCLHSKEEQSITLLCKNEDWRIYESDC